MKTTLEIPDMLFRKAKATAAQQGRTLREFVTEAVQEKLSVPKGKPSATPAWMELFGSAKKHAASLREIDAMVEQEFGQIEPEDRE